MSKFNKKMRYGSEHGTHREILRNMGYTLGKTIGEGTYSKVCVANLFTEEINAKVACKIIHKKMAGSEFIKKFLPRELRIIKNLQHPNIVRVFNIIDLHDAIYIIMDYCRNGDLLEFIRESGPLDEELSRIFFRFSMVFIDGNKQ